jgi:hypothetical protein
LQIGCEILRIFREASYVWRNSCRVKSVADQIPIEVKGSSHVSARQPTPWTSASTIPEGG